MLKVLLMICGLVSRSGAETASQFHGGKEVVQEGCSGNGWVSLHTRILCKREVWSICTGSSAREVLSIFQLEIANLRLRICWRRWRARHSSGAESLRSDPGRRAVGRPSTEAHDWGGNCIELNCAKRGEARRGGDALYLGRTLRNAICDP